MSDNEDIKVTKQLKVSAPVHGIKVQIDTLALKDDEHNDPEQYQIVSTAIAETDGEPLTEGEFNDFRRFNEDGNLLFAFFPASGILEIAHGYEEEIDLTVVVTLRERQQ